MLDHLRDDHRIDSQGTALAKRTREESDIKTAMTQKKEEQISEKAQKKFEIMASGINKPILEYLYLKWIINQNLSFDMIEDHDFRVFLQNVNEVANALLPTSHITIKACVMQLFQEGK